MVPKAKFRVCKVVDYTLFIQYVPLMYFLTESIPCFVLYCTQYMVLLGDSVCTVHGLWLIMVGRGGGEGIVGVKIG